LQNSTNFFWALRYVSSLGGWRQTLNIRRWKTLAMTVDGIGLVMSGISDGCIFNRISKVPWLLFHREDVGHKGFCHGII
jgi:hypothetical protein